MILAIQYDHFGLAYAGNLTLSSTRTLHAAKQRMKITRPMFKKCYASHLGGCNYKSREHFISRSILELIEPFKVEGLPWLKPGHTGPPSKDALTAAVLCGHHNSALSDFDFEASRLMSHLKLIDSKKTAQELASIPEVFVVDGVKFEKWLLKTLCGIMTSGNFLIDGKSFGKIAPSPYLVDLLFSSNAWKCGIGLYINYENLSRIHAMRGVAYDPVLAKQGTHANIVGIDIGLWGFPFRGLFAIYEEGQPLPNYRPRKLEIANGTVRREIRFIWPEESATTEGPILTRDGDLED